MYKLWLEWDFGQDDLTFKSPEDARHWLENESGIIEELDGDYGSIQEIFDDGLAAINRVRVYEP